MAFPMRSRTGVRRQRAIDRSGAGPPHKWCRRRGRIFRALTPVTTVISLCGMSTLTLFRLCVRAPGPEGFRIGRAADGFAEIEFVRGQG